MSQALPITLLTPCPALFPSGHHLTTDPNELYQLQCEIVHKMPRELEHRKRNETLVLGRAFGMHPGRRKRHGLSRKEQGEQFDRLIILMA